MKSLFFNRNSSNNHKILECEGTVGRQCVIDLIDTLPVGVDIDNSMQHKMKVIINTITVKKYYFIIK